MNTPPVIPPFRFATVDAGRAVAGRSAEASGVESVYRSAYPSLRNYRFLLGLDLQTIVSLVPSSEPVKDLAEFCELNSITHRHIQVPRFRGRRLLPPSPLDLEIGHFSALSGGIMQCRFVAEMHCCLVLACARRRSDGDISADIAATRRAGRYRPAASAHSLC
jgi:hypothetical protein